jgi:photosystem II stability/assembly factor-like uncharacterized protein
MDSGWGISETGGLVRYAGGHWSDASGGALPADLSDRLGGQPLASTEQPLTVGLNSVSFASPNDGYAVGGQGVTLHYQGGTWHREQSGTTETLSSVVDSHGGAVAVGSHGALLERGGDGWSRYDQGSSLVGGHDFSQVAAAPDGTVIALAGGSMIMRRPGQTDWSPAPLPPLAGPPSRLVVYRAASGSLHALVLVPSNGGQALLDGDPSGWRPVALPAGLQPSDVGVDPAGTTIWLAGQSGGHPAGAELPLTSPSVAPNLTTQASPGSAPQAPPSSAPQAPPSSAPQAPPSTKPQSGDNSGLAPLIRLMR